MSIAKDSILCGLALLLTLVVSHAMQAQAPKELHTLFEVAGQDSGALLGTYVKGIGDLNKDGYADVAVSAPGRLLTYVYFGGRIMNQAASLTFEGGGSMVSGDFNGDGWRDLAIEKHFRDTVLVYFGGPTMDTIPDLILTEPSNWFGYQALAAGDVNGDGFDDLIVGTQDENPQDSTNDHRGRIFVFAGSIEMSSLPVTILAGDTIRAGLGIDLCVGDVNEDGKQDIIALGNYYSFYLSVFLGNSLFHLKRNYYIDSRNVRHGFRDHVASFDADGDGIDDILVNGIYVFKGGPQLDTLPTYYINPPNNDTSSYGSYPWVDGGGDFNNDGTKDILLSSTAGIFGVVPGLFLMLDRRNHPGQYVAYKVWSDCCAYQLYGRPQNAGDVNGDGVDDIIIGSPIEPIFKDKGFFGIYSGDTTLITNIPRPLLSRSAGFELRQNYPNPFNPSTTIRYSIRTRSRVRLTIFNLLGQQIAVLANEEMNAGSYERTWNANVASGMYFYRIEVVSVSDPGKRFVDVKKMVLLK